MLYVYIKNSVRLPEGSPLKLSDIAELHQNDGSGTKRWDEISLGNVEKEMRLITCVELYKLIDLDENNVQIVGAQACAVNPIVQQDKGFKLFIKVLIVGIILFFGAGLTILNYHSDVDMISVHERISLILTGNEDFSKWFSLLYCIGVGLGVFFFANMLPGKKRSPSIFDIEQFQMDTQTEEYMRFKAEEKK